MEQVAPLQPDECLCYPLLAKKSVRFLAKDFDNRRTRTTVRAFSDVSNCRTDRPRGGRRPLRPIALVGHDPGQPKSDQLAKLANLIGKSEWLNANS